ncbi:heme-binding domain-containing protein [bacterium]|nr:heme-binding domain-containing protein [Flavobacteriaceae bacterium]MDC0118083.1 heme-binding domain-containing protein [bacterium]
MALKKKMILVLVITVVIAQFFQPKKNQGNFVSIDFFLKETQASKEVRQILKQACFDCHSSTTNYPWYNSITPVNFWLNSHIKEGKKHFNVSKWSTYSDKKKDHKLEELIEELEGSSMPLASYTWTHKEAQLNSAQVQALVDWANGLRSGYSSTSD